MPTIETSAPVRVKRVAEMIGVCERTVRDWIDDGMPCVRPSPRTTLVYLEDLNTYLEKFRQSKQAHKEQVDALVAEAMEGLI